MTDSVSENVISENLAQNIRRLREASGLSQQQVANAAQMPRPTWANLESGTANPTLGVLTKVAAALSVSVERLLAAPPGHAQHFVAASLPVKKRGNVEMRKLLPRPPVGLEVERCVFAPRAPLTRAAHAPGYREYLTCETGELDVQVGSTSYHLSTGDVLVFRADQPRNYKNPGTSRAVAYSVVSLAGAELG